MTINDSNRNNNESTGAAEKDAWADFPEELKVLYQLSYHSANDYSIPAIINYLLDKKDEVGLIVDKPVFLLWVNRFFQDLLYPLHEYTWEKNADGIRELLVSMEELLQDTAPEFEIRPRTEDDLEETSIVNQWQHLKVYKLTYYYCTGDTRMQGSLQEVLEDTKRNIRYLLSQPEEKAAELYKRAWEGGIEGFYLPGMEPFSVVNDCAFYDIPDTVAKAYGQLRDYLDEIMYHGNVESKAVAEKLSCQIQQRHVEFWSHYAEYLSDFLIDLGDDIRDLAEKIRDIRASIPGTESVGPRSRRLSRREAASENDRSPEPDLLDDDYSDVPF